MINKRHLLENIIFDTRILLYTHKHYCIQIPNVNDTPINAYRTSLDQHDIDTSSYDFVVSDIPISKNKIMHLFLLPETAETGDSANIVIFEDREKLKVALVKTIRASDSSYIAYAKGNKEYTYAIARFDRAEKIGMFAEYFDFIIELSGARMYP